MIKSIELVPNDGQPVSGDQPAPGQQRAYSAPPVLADLPAEWQILTAFRCTVKHEAHDSVSGWLHQQHSATVTWLHTAENGAQYAFAAEVDTLGARLPHFSRHFWYRQPEGAEA